MDKQDSNIAISYYIEEVSNSEKELDFDIQDLMNQIEETEISSELAFPQMINYNENYTVKELMLICDYYGFAKEIKSNRFNKEQIINYLVTFENDITNADIVFLRKKFWFYINELKNDKFMKKFVIW